MLAQTIQLALDAAITRKGRAEQEWLELLDGGAPEAEYTVPFLKFKRYEGVCEHLGIAIDLVRRGGA